MEFYTKIICNFTNDYGKLPPYFGREQHAYASKTSNMRIWEILESKCFCPERVIRKPGVSLGGDKMTEWGVVVVLITLGGGLVSIVKPIISLTGAITKELYENNLYYS